MKNIRIVATCKKGATIAKFSITPPLDLSVSKTFINIDHVETKIIYIQDK
ncbi:MAG: hypothetical protein ACPG7V_04680 [Flavobacteriaceae bacterium]